jgi:ELWxxDGT repeat protein
MDLVNGGGRLFLSATDPAHGREPWQSDGTSASTLLVQDINPGRADSMPLYIEFPPTGGDSERAPRGFLEVNGTLFFSADDGRHGLEPWALLTHLLHHVKMSSKDRPVASRKMSSKPA